MPVDVSDDVTVDVADVVCVVLVVGEVVGDEVSDVDGVVDGLVVGDVVGVLMTQPVLKSPSRCLSSALFSSATVVSQSPPDCFRYPSSVHVIAPSTTEVNEISSTIRLAVAAAAAHSAPGSAVYNADAPSISPHCTSCGASSAPHTSSRPLSTPTCCAHDSTAMYVTEMS